LFTRYTISQCPCHLGIIGSLLLLPGKPRTHKRNELLQLGARDGEVLLELRNLGVALGQLARERLELLFPAQTVLLRRAAVDRAAV